MGNWLAVKMVAGPITNLTENEIAGLTSVKHNLGYLLSFQSSETMKHNSWSIISNKMSPLFSTEH